MARLTARQRAVRVLDFLFGLRDPLVADALASVGFEDSDIAEGWSLLARTTPTSVGPHVAHETPSSLLAALDAWENRWLPVLDATLARRTPEFHALFLKEIGRHRSGDPMIVATMSTLLDRWRQIDTLKKESLRRQGLEAKALLARRGFTDTVVANAAALVERAMAMPNVVAAPARPASDFERADAQLWAYYLEWSRIARAGIRERGILRKLGFRSGAPTEDEDVRSTQEEREARSPKP